MPHTIRRKLDLLVLLGLAWTGLAVAEARRDGRAAGDATDQDDPGARQPPGRRAGAAVSAARSSEAGEGREADSPTQIPASGWWQIAKRVFKQISDHRLTTEAGAVTFFALLSIFPALAALVSLYGLIADPATVSEQMNSLAGVVPSGGMDVMGEQLKRLTASNTGALGFGAIFGLGLALWSANGATKSMFDALNVVYDEHEKRGFIRRTLLSLGLTLGGLVFVVLAMAAIVVLPVVLKFVGLGAVTDILLRVSRWPLLLVLVTVMLAVLYRYGPSRNEARWRWVSWGGAFAAIVWVLISALFSYYVAHFGSYNKTYGSLGAVVGFLTWIWISTIVVLIGAELNAEMEHQTARDTTTGPQKPVGARDATMANEVAPARS